MKNLAVAVSLTAAVLATDALVAPALAFDETSTAAVNVDEHGLGLRGFDPVAYFTDGAPVAGNARLTADYAEVTYYFTSEENREMFLENPSQFAPQYGGFCQMGAALGKKLDGDPEVWRVNDGRLFVYAYPEAKEGFLEDVSGNTEKANANWPLIKDKAPQDL